MHDYDFENRKIALLGFGKSNKEILDYIYRFTNDICIFDQKQAASLSVLSQYKGVSFFSGEDCFEHLQGFDYIFRSPAVRPDNEYILKEIGRGAILTSEIEVFVSGCRGKIIGVTGSDGKSTTSSLIYDILKNAGRDALLGGNIGRPVINLLDDITKDTYVVLELSSFQLMTLKNGIDTAVITNISPNHLDYHTSYDEYVRSKMNIAGCSGNNATLVINGSDPESVKYFTGLSRDIRYFNSNKGVYYDCGYICIGSDRIIDTGRMLLKGMHNIENMMAAIAATSDIADAGSFRDTAYGFRGIEHRMEFVGVVNGVTYINDSIATSPNRTTAGLRSFDRKVILIAGGKDKGISYDGIGSEIIKHVKHIIVFGQTKEAILKSVLEKDKDFGVSVVSTLEEAVKKASDIAKKDDIVFFSPASTSFDMFKNFEERGDLFKSCVNLLKELI